MLVHIIPIILKKPPDLCIIDPLVIDHSKDFPKEIKLFLTFDDLDEDSTSLESMVDLRRQVLLNKIEIENLHYLIGLLLFELVEQGVKIESEDLINELKNIQ